jgi:hypothetical protein
LDERKRSVTGFTNALPSFKANCPSEGRAYRLDQSVPNALVLQHSNWLWLVPNFIVRVRKLRIEFHPCPPKN